uniref:uncharacterized protein LOC101308585 isoform X1 n=1 Tax=Fragaria vesca subsp. vesca TaxID=101020 RepID=UPI0005C9CFEE|nr:PREDICTED: uncharacterized protein LOC101308585 isoform X1 [Fragaria vesca subsp. vesca]
MNLNFDLLCTLFDILTVSDLITCPIVIFLVQMSDYLDEGAYAIQDAQLFHLEQIQANRTDVEDQPPVTSIPAFTRCCQARLEKQFNTEINPLSHLHTTPVMHGYGKNFSMLYRTCTRYGYSRDTPQICAQRRQMYPRPFWEVLTELIHLGYVFRYLTVSTIRVVKTKPGIRHSVHSTSLLLILMDSLLCLLELCFVRA